MIRRANIHDVLPVTKLFREYMLEVYKDFSPSDTDFDFFGQVLTHPHSFVVLAQERRKFIGYGHAVIVKPFLGEPVVSVEGLFVVPSRRHAGLGSSLFKSLMAFAKSNGVERIELRLPAKYADNNKMAKAGLTPCVTVYTMSLPKESGKGK